MLDKKSTYFTDMYQQSQFRIFVMYSLWDILQGCANHIMYEEHIMNELDVLLILDSLKNQDDSLF